MNLEELKYPIGEFQTPETISLEHIKKWIDDIKELPAQLDALVSGLSTEELNYIYRPNGWNIKQVIHHIPDSHANGYIRFKLALTEDTPTIRPYLENRWAELADSHISDSLLMLKGIHARWSALLSTLTRNDLARSFYHPEAKQSFKLENYLGQYAWHGQHHLAHIEQALKFKGNFQHTSIS